MYFETFGEFLQMGKHGFYVWSAYGVAGVLLAWNIIAPVLRRRSFLREQSRRLRREQVQS